jgi:excisionase family DNA binding protein
MSDRVLVSVPAGVLALELDLYRQALAEGAALLGTSSAEPTVTDEPLIDAEALATALNLPVTWLEQAARERRIPSVQAGRYRRFKRSVVETALSSNGKHQ